jgi:hypothetical protein
MRRFPKQWSIIGVVALVAATGCENPIRSFRPPPVERVDLSPLLEAPIDSSVGLSAAFPDYEAVVIGGVQQSNGQVRKDGIVDVVTETYDANPARARTWYTDVIVTRFDTSERAARDLDSSCYSFVSGEAPDHPTRWKEGDYCLSSVLRRPTDPGNSYVPAEVYSSWVFVRRDRIVVRLYELHKDSAKTAKNAIIVELAERLSRVNPTPAAR